MDHVHSQHHLSWQRLFRSCSSRPQHHSARDDDDAAPELCSVRARRLSTTASSDSYGASLIADDCSETSVTLGPMSPLHPCASTYSSTAPCTHSLSPPSAHRASHLSEDDAIRSIADGAMKQIKSIASNAYVNGTWKQRRCKTNELVLEHRSATEYRIIAKSMVPCTIDEISDVLSCSSSDHFNAGMIELLGSEFTYGVTVRTLPVSKLDATASLALKVLAFSDSSCDVVDSDGNYIDYAERDPVLRNERRALQSIRRSRSRSDSDNSTVHIRAGSALCGYALHEDQETKHTVVLIYGTYALCSHADRAQRHTAIHRYRKIAQWSTKWAAIALRRRLGSQPILNSLADASRSLVEISCVGCNEEFHTLFRKRHFCSLCGLHACTHCSSLKDVEKELGKIQKLRVCHGCLADVNQRAFEPQRVPATCESYERPTFDSSFDELLDSRRKYRLF